VCRWSTRSPTYCNCTIHRDGKLHTQEYRLGEPQAPLAAVGTTDRRGTTVRFKPSPSIFTNITFDYDILAKRLRELSFLNSGVRIDLVDERDEQKRRVPARRRLTSFRRASESLEQARSTISVFHFRTQEGPIGVEVAMQWNDSYQRIDVLLHQQHSAERRRHAP
jgi:DNA gyrase subunit B